jgi:sodium-dependent dicarboxylate transporter 2/3/5
VKSIPRKIYYLTKYRNKKERRSFFMEKKKAFGICIAIAAIVVSFCLPENDYLTVAGIRTVGILVSFLVMLVTEALPVVVTSLIYCALMALLGITENLAAALSGYSQPIVFFTLASFGIAAALTTIPVSQRILRKLLMLFGNGIGSVLFAMMAGCAVFSSIVSNVPTCAIFMALSLDFLKLYEDEEERKKTGRAFMIAIPVASMIGGMMTPAGSSINLIAISQLEIYAGTDISFVQWMAAGIPMSIVLIPLAWLLAMKVYRPVPVSREKIREFIGKMSEDIPEKMGAKEKKVVVIVGVMLALWIASSWVSQINVMVVAILGCCVMFLPGIEVLDVDTFLRENSWDAFFLVGTVLSISSAMINNGVSECIAGLIPSLQVSTPVLIAFVAVLIFVSLIIIPVATSLIPILATTFITVAVNAGVSPALIMMTAAICACNCYLLPLDTVPLITYSKGYYRMTDMAKSTFFLQIAVVLLSALWLPVVGKIFGMM